MDNVEKEGFKNAIITHIKDKTKIGEFEIVFQSFCEKLMREHNNRSGNGSFGIPMEVKDIPIELYEYNKRKAHIRKEKFENLQLTSILYAENRSEEELCRCHSFRIDLEDDKGIGNTILFVDNNQFELGGLLALNSIKKAKPEMLNNTLMEFYNLVENKRKELVTGNSFYEEKLSPFRTILGLKI